MRARRTRASNDAGGRGTGGIAMSDLVPIIDLESGAVVQELDAACRSIGFFQVRSHGVERAVVDRMLEASLRFFRQPAEIKLRAKSPQREISRGYSSRGSQGVAYSMGVETPPDLVEAFTMARDRYQDGDARFAPIEGLPSAFAPNIWPEGVPGFREALVDYYAAVEALAARISRLMALALDLDGDFFDDKTDASIDSMRVNYYATHARDEPASPGQFGLGPHTDYGIITVLYAPPGPGLQVLAPSGDWHDVIPHSDCFVVNLGDFLAQWTNDRWRSTVHRAVQLARPESGVAERVSVPFFRQGNYDLVVECLPSCVSADNPARYPAVHAGEHFRAKLSNSRLFASETTVSTVGDRGSSLMR